MNIDVSKSSNLKKARYDAQTQTLEVTFESGESYLYKNVAPQVANALAEAPSKGGYLAKVIKPVAPYEKLPIATPPDVQLDSE